MTDLAATRERLRELAEATSEQVHPVSWPYWVTQVLMAGPARDFIEAASPQTVLALLADTPSVEPRDEDESPEREAAMWAYQFTGSLTTVYEFADDDIVPLLDHLSRMVEGKPTGNEDTAAVPGSVARWAASGAPLDALRPSVEPVGLAEALRALSADDPLALPGGDMSYAETLAARLWHAADHDCTIDGAAIRAALLPTQASDSPEKP